MFNQIVQEAEKILGVSAEVMVREGLKRFLLSRVEENDKVIDALKEKYGTGGYAELEEKIRDGSVPEHPTWEDIILWEELAQHNAKLKELVAQLEAGGAVAS